jgi:hypothetical protein
MKGKENAATCGGCYVTFTGKEAADDLRRHVYDDPCAHYANPSPAQLAIRAAMAEERDRPRAFGT